MCIKRLMEFISYNPESGVFVWAKGNSARRVSGTVAGCVSTTTGYRIIRVEGKAFPAARIAWAMMTGEFPEKIVDHINGCRSDDRWCNLRIADGSQNSGNSKMHKDNTSGMKGIEFHSQSGKWRARICKNGKRISLGLFWEKSEAHAAYVNAAKKIFKEYARAG